MALVPAKSTVLIDTDLHSELARQGVPCSSRPIAGAESARPAERYTYRSPHSGAVVHAIEIGGHDGPDGSWAHIWFFTDDFSDDDARAFLAANPEIDA